jgi:hypothetical protein
VVATDQLSVGFPSPRGRVHAGSVPSLNPAGHEDQASSDADPTLSRRQLLARVGKWGWVGLLSSVVLGTYRHPPTDSATHGPGRALMHAAPPSGGDDSEALAALCSGDRDVQLQQGATYVLAAPDAIRATGFTGRVLGNGATLRFTYQGPFHVQHSAISGLTGATFQDLSITAPDSTLFSIFRDCTDLHLENVTVFACSPKLTYAMPRGFSARHIRWVSIGADPDIVDGSLHVPDAGDFILSDFSYDTRFNGQTGAIISAVATRPRQGATVHISDGQVFVSDLPGHTADGAIDIEPMGLEPFDTVSVKDVVLYNTSLYLTGARRIDVSNVTVKYTANNESGRAVPFVVYNSNRVKPSLGELRVSHCEVQWFPDHPSNEESGVLTYQGQPGAVVYLLNNRYELGFSREQVIDSLYWVKDEPPAALVLDGEVVLDVGDGWVSRNALVQADTAVQRLILRNSVFQGRYAQKLAMQPIEGNGGLVLSEDNNFSSATFAAQD